MEYILAIDQGTSSTRAMLYDLSGALVTTSQYPFQQYYPQPGWVEHDPEEIWIKTLKSIQDVVNFAGDKKIIGCGITNQRETTVLWDKQTGHCLGNAIVWQDRRTQEFCQSLAEYKLLIQHKTGLVPDPYFSATKIHWILNHHPEAKQLLAENRLAFGTIDSFLIWRLTGGKSHLTDVTNASRTLLLNIHTQQWDEELLNIFSIPTNLLPEVCASDSFFGEIDASLFGYSVPIHGVAGDQQAALVGQHCFQQGMTKSTFGTGGCLLMNCGEEAPKSKHNLLTTIAYRLQGKTVFGLEGSLYHAGTTVKWLRDEMKLISTAAETEELAASLSSNDGVYLVSSFTGLGAPYWISTPGACIVGLSRNSNRAHFARAALEGVCYQTREVLTCMREDSNLDVPVIRVDGGMAANNWFLQFLANQCDVEVQRPAQVETTSKGAALIAAIGLGLIDMEALHTSWNCEYAFSPDKNQNTRKIEFQGWQHALRMVQTR